MPGVALASRRHACVIWEDIFVCFLLEMSPKFWARQKRKEASSSLLRQASAFLFFFFLELEGKRGLQRFKEFLCLARACVLGGLSFSPGCLTGIFITATQVQRERRRERETGAGRIPSSEEFDLFCGCHAPRFPRFRATRGDALFILFYHFIREFLLQQFSFVLNPDTDRNILTRTHIRKKKKKNISF